MFWSLGQASGYLYILPLPNANPALFYFYAGSQEEKKSDMQITVAHVKMRADKLNAVLIIIIQPRDSYSLIKRDSKRRHSSIIRSCMNYRTFWESMPSLYAMSVSAGLERWRPTECIVA